MDLYMGQRLNTISRLKEFFGIGTEEFLEFWEGLSPEERKEWREADLYG